MELFPTGATIQIRDDLETRDGAKSWAAGKSGVVVDSRPAVVAGGLGDVRVRFNPCHWCFQNHKCAAVHWIKIEDLAVRRALDVVFDFVPD